MLCNRTYKFLLNIIGNNDSPSRSGGMFPHRNVTRSKGHTGNGLGRQADVPISTTAITYILLSNNNLKQKADEQYW